MKTAELLAPAPATISARTGEVLDNLGAWLGHGRFDSWENSVTGFGTLRDKTIFSAFMPTPMLGDVTLEQLYHHDDLAARMIDTVPEEMLRKGYCLDIEDSQDLAEDTIAALTELDANSKIIEAEIWAKTFGGAVLIPVADDGFPAYQPLRPERVKAVTSLEVIDRRFVYPHSFYRTGPKRDQVEVYAHDCVPRRAHVPDTAHVSQSLGRVRATAPVRGHARVRHRLQVGRAPALGRTARCVRDQRSAPLDCRQQSGSDRRPARGRRQDAQRAPGDCD
jgi:hypothetical protein